MRAFVMDLLKPGLFLPVWLTVLATVSIGCNAIFGIELPSEDLPSTEPPSEDPSSSEPGAAKGCDDETSTGPSSSAPTDACWPIGPLCTFTDIFVTHLDCDDCDENPSCHALYQAAVAKVYPDRWHVDLAFKKADGSRLPPDLHVWVASGPDAPSCADLGSYAIRFEDDIVTGSAYTAVLENVPVWPDQATYDSAPISDTENIFIITDGDAEGNAGNKIWFQKQAIPIQKRCQ